MRKRQYSPPGQQGSTGTKWLWQLRVTPRSVLSPGWELVTRPRLWSEAGSRESKQGPSHVGLSNASTEKHVTSGAEGGALFNLGGTLIWFNPITDRSAAHAPEILKLSCQKLPIHQDSLSIPTLSSSNHSVALNSRLTCIK